MDDAWDSIGDKNTDYKDSGVEFEWNAFINYERLKQSLWCWHCGTVDVVQAVTCNASIPQ